MPYDLNLKVYVLKTILTLKFTIIPHKIISKYLKCQI